MQSLDVFSLISNRKFITFLPRFFGLAPFGPFNRHCFLVWNDDFTHDDITSVPRLCIKHVEGEPLVLHPDVEELRVGWHDHTFVQLIAPQPVGCLQPQLRRKEWEMMPSVQ
jgi:hypothetical protein